MHDSQLYLGVAAIGGIVLVVGLLSGAIRQSLVSEPLLALAFGILLGPAVAGWLDPAEWGEQRVILEEGARITLAIGLMAVALRLPPGYFRRQWRSLAVLLVPLMLLMWAISGLLCWMILGTGLWLAMLIGACLTPTDPILASGIVGGSFARTHLTDDLRHTISAESGANDGLGLALVMLSIYLLLHAPGEAVVQWLTHTLLWELLSAVGLGLLLGSAAGHLLHWAERRHTIVKTSLLSYGLALSLTVLGVSQLLGSNGVLAVFVAGRGFVSVATLSERHEEERVQEAVNQFFVLPVFVLLGMSLPWQDWFDLGARGVLLAAAILLLRRLPGMLALRPFIPTLRRRDDAAFAGWFGPIGVAALLYAGHSTAHFGEPLIWTVVSLIVTVSIVAHGVTAAPAIRRHSKA